MLGPTFVIDASLSFQYAKAQLRLADELLELMDPVLKQPWVSIERTHRLGWVGSELDNEVRKENLAAGSHWFIN